MTLPELHVIKVGEIEIAYNETNHIQRTKDEDKDSCPEYDIIKHLE